MRDLAAARLTSACLESKIGGFGIYRIDRDFAEESRNFSPAGLPFSRKPGPMSGLTLGPSDKMLRRGTTYALKETSDYDLRLR